MKSTLIALAVAGVVASSGVTAGTTIGQVNRDFGVSGFVPAQYVDRYYDRSDERSTNINEREAQLRARIDRGLNDGRLTRQEARRLYRELASIEAKERSFKADGRLNWREDAALNRDLDRLAENVRTQLRDDERRYSYDQYGRPYIR